MILRNKSIVVSDMSQALLTKDRYRHCERLKTLLHGWLKTLSVSFPRRRE
ncbi:hypothetical protein [Rickettsia endosymbiont of Orchestes rusci]